MGLHTMSLIACFPLDITGHNYDVLDKALPTRDITCGAKFSKCLLASPFSTADLEGSCTSHCMLSENVGCLGHGYTMQVWDTNNPPSFSERERAKSARSHSECLPFKETVSLCRKWVTLAKGCYKNISGGLHVDSACIMCMCRCVCMHAGVKNTGLYKKDPPPPRLSR